MKKVCSNEYEHMYWSNDQLILGIDEAGRGPLAGPLSVAGVVFPCGYEDPEIYDSKSLSEKKRDMLYDRIMENALWFMIMEVSEEEIDRYNIYRADQMAMESLAKSAPADIVLTDAMPLSIENKECISLIKGDRKSVSIAAASILAKVTRDRIMIKYDEMYPGYGFAKHKGYPTKYHLEKLEELGPCPIHRRSFGPVAFSQMKLPI